MSILEIPSEVFIYEILSHISLKDIVSICKTSKLFVSYLKSASFWAEVLGSFQYLQFRNLLIAISKTNNFFLWRLLYDLSKEKKISLTVDENTYEMCASYFFLCGDYLAAEYVMEILDEMNYSLYLPLQLLKDKDKRDIATRTIEELKLLFGKLSTDSEKNWSQSDGLIFLDSIDRLFDERVFIIKSEAVVKWLMLDHVNWSTIFSQIKHVSVLYTNSYCFYKYILVTLVNKGMDAFDHLKEIANIRIYWNDMIYATADDTLPIEYSKSYDKDYPIRNKFRYLKHWTETDFAQHNFIVPHYLRTPYICFDPEEFVDVLKLVSKRLDLSIIALSALEDGYHEWLKIVLREYDLIQETED